MVTNKYINMNKKMILIGAFCVVVLMGCGSADDEISEVNIIEECQAEDGCDNFVSGTLSPEEFKKKLDSGEYDLIDMRTHDEYMNERIADVPNIDIYEDDFNDRLNYLDKEKKYLIYCRSGNRTKMGLNRMKAYGFKEAYDLEGGINAWKEAGFPTIN
jgi:rhodanese-related sulfurtransferase